MGRVSVKKITERRDYAVSMLKLMWPTWRILDGLQAEFGIGRKAAHEDIGRARAKMREEDDTPRSDKRSKLSAYLEEIMSSKKAGYREKLRAATEYAKLHGLREQAPAAEVVESDVEIVIPDWRAEYKARLNSGDVRSVNGTNGTNST